MARNTLLFHLSDIHFGLEDNEALDWVQAEIAARRPAAVAITGDLTMRARHREFAAACRWIRSLEVPVTVEIGNHDMPYFNLVERFFSPYRRFREIQGLIDDLKAHRLQITKAHLAEDFETAFDLALYSLCVDILHLGYRADPLNLRAVQTREHSSLGDLKDTPAAQRLAARREALHPTWLSLPPAEGFAEMSALSSEAKRALFAWCIAQTLQPQLAFEDRVDAVIEQVGKINSIETESRIAAATAIRTAVATSVIASTASERSSMKWISCGW